MPANLPRAVLPLLVLVVVTVLVFNPMLEKMRTDTTGDYPTHLRYVQEIQQDVRQLPPHPLFHLGTILVATLIPVLSITQAGLLLILAMYAISGLMIYRFYLSNAISGTINRPTAWLLSGLTLALMLVSAVTVFTWSARNLYFGYFVGNVYHNPTIVLLKPLALGLFLYALGVFSAQGHFHTRGAWAAAFVLTVLCGLAKPNYLIVLLPTLGLVTVYRLLKKQPVNWPLLLSIALPAVVLLGLQFFMLPRWTQTAVATSDGKIAFAPLALFRAWGVFDKLIFLRIVMSVLFPIVVYAAYVRPARRDFSLNLAWLSTMIGIFYTLCFVETGARLPAGNFGWSAQITIFILFVVSMSFFLRQIYDLETRRFRLNRTAGLCLAVFALHLISGLLWYATELTTASNAHWW